MFLLRYIFLLVLLISSLFSNENFEYDEKSIFKEALESQEIISNEQELQIVSKSLYLNYMSYPNDVYKNQRFSIKLKAIITTDIYDFIETDFSGSNDLTILNPRSHWKWKSDNNFENEFYFKITGNDPKLPEIRISLCDIDSNILENAILEPKELKYSNIAIEEKNYSQVIANNLELISYKTKQYDNKSLLTIFEIKASKSNLEDFYLKEFTRQNIESISNDGITQTLMYSVIIPIHTKSIKFDYYNNFEKKFITVEIPAQFEEELISTQTDLNPNNSSFEFLKKVLLVIVTVVFLIIFFIKRNIIYLSIAALFSIILLILVMPNKKAFINKGTKVYILPTNNSTVFKIVPEKEEVEILLQKNGFVKILLKNKSIGWISKNDIGTN